MNKEIIEFIDKEDCVYIVETNDIDLNSTDPNIGEEVIGIGKKGVLFEYHQDYEIAKWSDIEEYTLVSIVDCYSSDRNGYDRKKIVAIFDCKTLESTELDLELY